MNGTVSTLTDGTGISQLLASKIVKDFVADFLLALPPVFIGLSITDLNGALAAPAAVAIGVGDALIRVVYRSILKWATS